VVGAAAGLNHTCRYNNAVHLETDYKLVKATNIPAPFSPEVTAGRKRIALLGGSFDPVTNAHILQAAEILHAEKADEVWLVPCGRRSDKPSLKTPYLHRLTRCHLAINSTYGSEFPLRVSDVEMPFEMALQTLDCIEELEKQYPDKDFIFVLGSDLLPGLLWWCKEPERQKRLLSKRFLVINRPGYEIEKRMTEIPSWVSPKKWPDGFAAGKLPENFDTLVESAIGTEIVSQNLSSSEIRLRFSESDSMVEGLVPGVVLAHMIRYNLYTS
jgi:nicotinate (nicotinamide) nucleotide adenylyltransferase